MTLLTVDWDLPHQSTTKKMSADMLIGQFDQENSSVKAPSLYLSPVCDKLKKKKTKQHKFYTNLCGSSSKNQKEKHHNSATLLMSVHPSETEAADSRYPVYEYYQAVGSAGIPSWDEWIRRL